MKQARAGLLILLACLIFINPLMAVVIFWLVLLSAVIWVPALGVRDVIERMFKKL